MTRRDERTIRVRERVSVEMPDFDAALTSFQRPLPASVTPQLIPTGSLVGAMAGWFGLVLAVCYVASPVLRASLGLLDNLPAHLVFNIPAFLMTGFVATIAAAIARPTVTLSPNAPRDPVLAATLGGLLTWGVVHNLSPLLEPFAAMGPAELAAFVAANVVEMTLLGMMLASFTRSSRTAFGLGALLQLLMLGLVSGLVIL